MTLFPLPVQKELIAARRELSYINMNYIPFVDIIQTITGGNIQSIARIIGGNILLFVPLGSILPLIYKKANNLGSVVLCGLLASIVIETLQLTISTLIGFNYRSADINDLILNTLGTVIGFYLLKLVLSILKENFDVSHLYKT